MLSASLGQAAPHLVDQAPKSPLYQTAQFYPSKNPIPPCGVSNDEKFVLLGQMCKPGEWDLTYKTESTAGQTPSQQQVPLQSKEGC